MAYLQTFFANYEHIKLLTLSPTADNIIIAVLLFLCAMLMLRTRKTTLLDKEQTQQIRGIAILLVVLGHLWTHAAGLKDIPVFGSIAVTVFLMLSGYGLYLSLAKMPLNGTSFLRSRLARVMIPYWVATLVILALDYLLLGQTHPGSIITWTFLGINMTEATWYLDYTRWYVTLLLLAYVFFFLSFRWLQPARGLPVLFAIFASLYVLSLAKMFPLGKPDQLFAFPIGCLLAAHRARIAPWLESRRSIATLLAISLAGIFASASVDQMPPLQNWLGQRLLIQTATITSGTLSGFAILLACIFLGRLGKVSIFLSFMGGISYELFLLHGPLLIKYNVIMPLTAPVSIPFAFLVWLSYSALVAIIFKKSINSLTQLAGSRERAQNRATTS